MLIVNATLSRQAVTFLCEKILKMSDQGFSKVDLSLDDIIKLHKKERQQNRVRGGAARGRGGARGRGLGLQGQRTRGVGRGGSGVSPLNKRNTGTGSATLAMRGQGARRGGQRGGNLRGRGGLRGGLTRGGRGGVRGQVTTRGGAGVQGSRGSLKVRGTRSNLRGNMRGTLRGNRGTLRGALRGTRGNLRGALRGAGGNVRGSLRGQGSVTIRGQGQGRGALRQGQGRGAMNRVSLKQKRELAVQTLRLAQKTIAQLDQRSARQNFVNARRGIVQQQQPVSASTNQGLYSSTMPLTSPNSTASLSSTRQLLGTQVTTFNPVRSQQNPRGRRRWRPQAQSSLPVSNSSMLTISIDNSTPLSTPNFSSPQVTVPAATAPKQPQRLRRRPWQRQNRSNSNNNNYSNNTTNSSFSYSYPGTGPDVQEFRAGASPEFSQQLMDMKPTVSTKYVFEKKAFSTANTSCSLNDRFSGNSTDSLMGRKVFL